MSSSLVLARPYEQPMMPVAPRRQFRVIEGGAAHDVHPLSVTPRERVVYGIAAFVLMFVLAFTWRMGDVRTQNRVQEALSGVSYEVIVVHPGDTLWSIAQSHPVAGCSTDELVRHMRAHNNLESANLSVGARLSVPSV